jgi:predicted porin
MTPKLPPFARLLLLALLPFASGACLAQSSVQMYGVADVGATARQLSGATRTKELQNGAMTTSHFGLRGQESLGGGYSGLFALESFLRADSGEVGRSGADPFWGRNAWVGMATPFGTVRLGRQSTPAFVMGVRTNAFGSASGVGPYMMHTHVASVTQPMLTGQGTSDAAWNNSVGYTSPSWSGLSFSAMVAAGEGSTGGRRWTAASTYAAGPLVVGLAVERLSSMALAWGAPTAALATAARPLFTGRDAQSVHLGASYNFGSFKAFAQGFKSQIENVAGSKIELATTNFGATMPVGQGELLLSWARTDKEQTSAAKIERNTVSFGYDHRLTKRTDVYVVLVHDKVSILAKGQSAVLGVRHAF